MFSYGHKHKGCTYLHCLYVCILSNRNKCLRSAFNLQKPRFCSRKSTNKFLEEIITEPNVKNYIKCLVSKYQNGGLNSINIVQNTEFKSLSAIIDKRIKIMDDMKALSELVQMDVKMKPLATEEELLYEEDLKEIDIELLSIILNNYSVPNYDSIIIEIQAGVGGDEATLFVLDLYNMYIGHIKYLGLSIETILDDDIGQSGYRHVAISVSGNQAFEKFRFEGGVHRVQRIPYTEKLGRVHTSTASVAILPTLTNEEVELHPRDLKIETKKASGPGGQHVNCTDSAVRITHIPSGIISVCQMGRSQHKNKEIALQKLRNILYEQILQRHTTFRSNMRKQQLGLRMRNEKIRTYNFQQDRVTDHRLNDGTVHNIKNFMKGGKALEEIENKLSAHMQKELIMDIIKETSYFKT